MSNKDIFIFTDKDLTEEYMNEWLNEYISTTFGGYTLIATEDNSNYIINEESDAYMIMEFI